MALHISLPASHFKPDSFVEGLMTATSGSGPYKYFLNWTQCVQNKSDAIAGIYAQWRIEEKKGNAITDINEVLRVLEEAQKKATENNQLMTTKLQRTHDMRTQVLCTSFKAGDYAIMRCTKRCKHKLSSNGVGPLCIFEVKLDRVYLVEDLKTTRHEIVQIQETDLVSCTTQFQCGSRFTGVIIRIPQQGIAVDRQ